VTKSGARPPRSDRRRNHERLLAVATDLVACDGAQVSLEEIARRAGVGSATLHRHFPSRRALLEEIFHEGVARLCRRAGELSRDDPGTGLVTWLEELTLYTTNTRGLAASLVSGPGGLPPEDTCHGMLLDAANDLVTRAVEAGAVRSGVEAADLIVLTNAISLATEGDPATAGRLLRLALNGVHP
jgi:AcrR family transcriptional regulator